MTILCYKNGILCSDSKISSDGTLIGYTKKIFKSPDGWLAGAAGGATITRRLQEWMSIDIQSMRNWDTNICKEEEQALIISPEGKVFGGTCNGYYEIDFPYQAEGSAYKVAMGAMEFGAPAYQATEIAIRLEPGLCGGEIQVLRLGD